MKKRIISILLAMAALLSIASASGCSSQNSSGYSPIPGLDTKEPVEFKIAIPYETNKALNTLANSFMKKYPNVSIQLQYVEDYDSKALQLLKDNAVDLIMQKDVNYSEYSVKDETTGEETPTGDNTDDYFYNFAADTEINFSDTTAEISDNYRHTRTDESGNSITYQYSYPLGGETRGFFVNTTLLKQYNLSVPKNYTELLECCKVLKENGLVPIQGGAATSAYGLGIAQAANTVTHDEAALEKMRNAEEGVSEEFRSVMEKLYELTTNRYFDYKAVEENGYFLTSNELGQASGFLGLRTDENSFEVSVPENNYGYAAFWPYISSSATVIDNLIEKYKLSTEYEFICTPLNDEDSNSPMYVTPYYGLSINKNSTNLSWCREFINFTFADENARTFAENANIIPNTKDALDYAAKEYGSDTKKDITLSGQIRFSDDYNGFSPIGDAFVSVVKCSAQKYMVVLEKDSDGNILYGKDDSGNECLTLGNEETKVAKEYIGEEDAAMPGYAFCTLEYYMAELENNFAKYRVK